MGFSNVTLSLDWVIRCITRETDLPSPAWTTHRQQRCLGCQGCVPFIFFAGKIRNNPMMDDPWCLWMVGGSATFFGAWHGPNQHGKLKNWFWRFLEQFLLALAGHRWTKHREKGTCVCLKMGYPTIQWNYHILSPSSPHGHSFSLSELPCLSIF